MLASSLARRLHAALARVKRELYRDTARPAATLIVAARMTVLNRKAISPWARASLRIERVSVATSAVWQATPMTKET